MHLLTIGQTGHDSTMWSEWAKRLGENAVVDKKNMLLELRRILKGRRTHSTVSTYRQS